MVYDLRLRLVLITHRPPLRSQLTASKRLRSSSRRSLEEEEEEEMREELAVVGPLTLDAVSSVRRTLKKTF